MKKYFYTNGVDKIGPFSFEELKRQNLSRETKVWFYGLDNWTTLSEVDELNSITNSLPPLLKISNPKVIQNNNLIKNDLPEKVIEEKKSKNRRTLIQVILGAAILTFAVLISYILTNSQGDNNLYQEVVSSAYETDVDFDFYVDKFYRDINVYGIFPKKPVKKIIKFAKFDQIDNTTHYHGVSYGINDDNKIEIYINPSTWEKFNKPMRYYLMYHELAHDVLNLDDLENSPTNEGKLMFPAISSYESITMDDFIENSHALFEEVAANQ